MSIQLDSCTFFISFKQNRTNEGCFDVFAVYKNHKDEKSGK